MQSSFEEIVKREPDISSGKESRSRVVYDILSRTLTRADTILFKGGITNLDDYPKDNDHPANSEKGMDANLEDNKDNSENKSMKKNKIQRTLSSTVKLPH